MGHWWEQTVYGPSASTFIVGGLMHFQAALVHLYAEPKPLSPPCMRPLAYM